MTRIKPWEKIGEPITLAQENDKSLVVQKFINPKTNQAEQYALFHCSKLPVIIFALTKKLEVIVVNQYRHGIGQIVLELPGGSFEHQDQTLLEAAKRELLEETGYKTGKIIPLLPSNLWIDPGTFTPGLTPFISLNCEKVCSPRTDENEIIETKVIPLRNWLRIIYEGAISDTKTIAITFLALLRFSELKK